MKKILLFCALTIFMGLSARADEYYDLNDHKYSYEDISGGEKTTLFIWATWCPTCRAKLKELTRADMRGDVKINFLDLGETRSKVLKALDSLGVPPERRNHVYRDPFEGIADRFYFVAIPTVVFFKDGKAVYTANSLTPRMLDQIYGPEPKKGEPPAPKQ